MLTKQKTLSEQNQKIVGILTTYSESKDLHTGSGLCSFFFREPFYKIARINSYAFFGLFVRGYLVGHDGYCEKRQIMVDMIIDLFVNFNPTLEFVEHEGCSLKCTEEGFKEAFKMIKYYGGYRDWNNLTEV